jgi:VTC domain
VSVPRPQLPAAERLEPIGLEALDAAAALRRRFDTKYLLPRVALDRLIARLEPTHHVLEVDGLRDFDYRTTYFDTRELEAFRDHLQGRRRRLKVRVRHYVDTGDCYLELKLRGARECTIKRRLPHDPSLPHSLTADGLAALERWVRNAYDRPAPGPLAPVLDVAYRRATLVAPERGERLTVDLDLHMRAAGADGWGRLDPDIAIVETKSARGPTLGGHELIALGARPLDRMSKYCVGVVLAHGRARGNALLPVLRHCSGRYSPIGALCAR